MLRDISIPLSASTREWPGDTPFSCGWTMRIADGESVNLGTITTSFHVGTHADAPLHVHEGWPASEALALDAFVGEVVVIAVPEHVEATRELGRDELEAMLSDALGAGASRVPERLLLRTGHCIAAGAFPDAWPVLTSEAAEWLVAQGLRLWGVDAPSVDERTSKTLPVHHAILGRGAFVLENLDLRAVAPGRYELIAPPLAVDGADAAPVRAVLRNVR